MWGGSRGGLWGFREKGEEGMDGCRLWRRKKFVFFFF